MAHQRGEPPIVLGSGGPVRFPAERYEGLGDMYLDRGKGDLISPPLAGQELNERVPFVVRPTKGDR